MGLLTPRSRGVALPDSTIEALSQVFGDATEAAARMDAVDAATRRTHRAVIEWSATEAVEGRINPLAARRLAYLNDTGTHVLAAIRDSLKG